MGVYRGVGWGGEGERGGGREGRGERGVDALGQECDGCTRLRLVELEVESPAKFPARLIRQCESGARRGGGVLALSTLRPHRGVSKATEGSGCEFESGE